MTVRSVRSRFFSCAAAVVVSLFICDGVARAQGITAPIPESSALTSDAVQRTDRTRPAGAFADLFSPLAGDFGRLASKQNRFLIGVGSAGALAAHSVDDRVTTMTWGNARVAAALEPGRIAGNFLVQTTGALATYAAGRITNAPRVAAVGASLVRAQVVAQTTSQAIKLASSRTRPDGTSLSFPSGHTSSAFATASVIQSEFGWKAGVPAFAVAGWIATSRVHAKRHYFSDVIAGATVGVIAGRTVTIGSGSARFAISPTAVPGGVGIGFTKVSNR